MSRLKEALIKDGDVRNSLTKVLFQLAVVAKGSFEGKGKEYNPPQTLTISPTFWREYGCYLGCGGCCRDWTLNYLPSEVEVFSEHYSKWSSEFVEQKITINGVEKILYLMPQISYTQWRVEWCRFLGKGGECRIHKLNPFSCHIELIRFVNVKGSGHIQKSPYARQWYRARVVDGIKGDLLCTFSDQFSLKQFEGNDLPVLRRMLTWANYLGIKTYLPEIIHQAIVSVYAGNRKAVRIH